jgi:hypothetical protein
MSQGRNNMTQINTPSHPGAAMTNTPSNILIDQLTDMQDALDDD